MAKTKHVLNVQPRVANGTGDARRLRKTGMIPAVVYSRGTEPLSLSVNARDWDQIARHELNLLTLHQESGDTLVLLKEVQHDYIRNCAMHLDFMAVRADQIITAHVAMHPGHDAPAGEAVGGILDQNLHELEVACKPDDLPETIEVDISALNIGDLLHVKDIVLPAGVKAVTHGDLVAFQVIDPNAQPDDLPEPVAAEETDAAAEPEVIGEKERAEKAAAAESAKGDKKK